LWQSLSDEEKDQMRQDEVHLHRPLIKYQTMFHEGPNYISRGMFKLETPSGIIDKILCSLQREGALLFSTLNIIDLTFKKQVIH
jgi:hypothetical protein